MFTAILLALAPASDPVFEVENKTFKVESKTDWIGKHNDRVRRMLDSLKRMDESLDRLEKSAKPAKVVPYTPPPCAACNRGENQCACPLWYGKCECRTATITAPAVPPRPFSASTTATTAPGRSGTAASTSPVVEYRLRSLGPVQYGILTRTNAGGAVLFGGTSGCAVG